MNQIKEAGKREQLKERERERVERIENQESVQRKWMKIPLEMGERELKGRRERIMEAFLSLSGFHSLFLRTSRRK